MSSVYYKGAVVAAIMNNFNWSNAILITTMDVYGTDAGDYLRAANVSFVQIYISTSGIDFESLVYLFLITILYSC